MPEAFASRPALSDEAGAIVGNWAGSMRWSFDRSSGAAVERVGYFSNERRGSRSALPRAEIGEWLVFRDAGADGSGVWSNYNSRPLAAEVLVDDDEFRVIRRRQTIEELIALRSPLRPPPVAAHRRAGAPCHIAT
jgi:hypothetical protein